MMLPTDLALLRDASFKRYVVDFAEDQNLWFGEFAKAWTRLQDPGPHLKALLVGYRSPVVQS